MAIALVLWLAPKAHAGTLTEQIRGNLDRVFTTLADPGLRSKPEARRRAIGEITRGLFAWEEMARRALGRYWLVRTDAERDAFVTALATRVDTNVLGLEHFAADVIEYTGESVEGDEATVTTRARGVGGRPVTLEYRFVRVANRWLVYDVVLDNASMLGMYRAQFQRVMKTASYDRLLEMLSATN
ncbi:MAG: MlaC/ttg2D family ABC transporter substrate-binding protein [Candidatus Rokuibacteriota bacterium]